jgi:thiol:disulfide interchange protein DsbD
MTKKNTTIYFLLVVAIFFLLPQSISAQQKSLAEARLVANSFSSEKDSIISLGVLINLQDDWHIYWRNPGDSGLPTDIEIILPNGITASEIKFPIPKIFASEEIVNYGYGHQVLFLFDVNVPENYSLVEINISAKINSLICKEMCKAFDTTVTITLDLSIDFIADENTSTLFKSTEKMLPIQNQNLNIIAESKSNDTYLKVFVDENERQSINSIQFYPYKEGVFRNSAKQNIMQKENYFEIMLEPDQFRIKDPALVKGIIIIEEIIENNLSKKAYEIEVPIIQLI